MGEFVEKNTDTFQGLDENDLLKILFPGLSLPLEGLNKISNRSIEDAIKPVQVETPGSVGTLEDISGDLFEDTAGIRDMLFSNAEDVLSGGFDPTTSPLYGSLKNTTEQQFDTARDQVLATLPEGGALQSGLTDVEIGRAGAMVEGLGDLTADQLNKAFQIGTGTPLTSITGLTGAGNIQAQIANANAMQNAAFKESLGQGIGTYFGQK